VFGRCGAAELEQAGEFARSPGPLAQLVEDNAPCRVGDSTEHIRKHRFSICRKFPTYLSGPVVEPVETLPAVEVA
jgi:hypothetical protein